MDRIEIFWGKCKKCNAKFEVYADGALDYGSRLLESYKNHQLAKAVHGLDPAFEEISGLVRDFLRPLGFSEIQMTRKFDEVFGKICDPAPDGSFYDMSGKVTCLVCQSDSVSWGPSDPPIFRDIELPHVTHKKWDALNLEQKRKTVEELLKKLK